MKPRRPTKCRERLAVEGYIRANKKRGVPLSFGVGDVIANSDLRLNRRGVVKAVQNMVYVKAGLERKAGEPGVYVATVDDHPGWTSNLEHVLPSAATSTIKFKGTGRGKRRRRRVAARGTTRGVVQVKKTDTQLDTIVDTLTNSLVNVVMSRLSEKLAERFGISLNSAG